MDPFAQAAAALARSVLAADVEYRQAGSDVSRPVRAVLSAPDTSAEMGLARVQGADVRLYVAIADISMVEKGDQFYAGKDVFAVVDANRDAERVTWVVDCVSRPQVNRAAMRLAGVEE